MEWGSDEYECDQAIDGMVDGDKRNKRGVVVVREG